MRFLWRFPRKCLDQGFSGEGFLRKLDPHQPKIVQSFVSEKIPVRRIGKPEDVAEAVIMLMSNGYISGEILNLTGGEHITGGEYITNVFKAFL